MKAWSPCEPPPGYCRHGKPYRCWSHAKSGASLLECPTFHLWIDSGEWILMHMGTRKVLSRLAWYGRGRKSPPTTWANKQLRALKPKPPTEGE